MTGSASWRKKIYNMGFQAIEHIVGYFLLGAAVVIPIWIVIRLLNMGKTNPN